MKKIYVFVLIIFLAISVYSFYAYNNEKDIEQDKEITVILAVNSNIVKTDSKVLKGYESFLLPLKYELLLEYQGHLLSLKYFEYS